MALTGQCAHQEPQRSPPSSGGVVGKPYLRITSELLVTRPESVASIYGLPDHMYNPLPAITSAKAELLEKYRHCHYSGKRILRTRAFDQGSECREVSTEPP